MLEQMGIAAKQASYKLSATLQPRKKSCWKKSPMNWKHKAKVSSTLTRRMLQTRVPMASEAMLDRLALTPARLKGIADDVRRCAISPIRWGR